MSYSSKDKLRPWGQEEKDKWFSEQIIRRSYADEVVAKIKELENDFSVTQYGDLEYKDLSYPLFLIHNKSLDKDKKTVLITGGVHGYETSGVQGALRFLKDEAKKYSEEFNIVVTPCISPWGYETINRWNPLTVDPNRSFQKDGPSQEANKAMEAVLSLNLDILVHIDLHETTDTDNTVFRPALEMRDGVKQDVWDIPDGFYTVGDSENPVPEFQKAIINSVKKVTHIAPADENGKIIGEPIQQEGVINYPVKSIFLCAGFTNAKYVTTTEVYPDSPKVNDENCTQAQVAAVVGALDYIKNL